MVEILRIESKNNNDHYRVFQVLKCKLNNLAFIFYVLSTLQVSSNQFGPPCIS